MKIFLVSVTKNDEPIDIDLNKIKVTMTSTIETKKLPIVKLKRWTKEEIENYTKIQRPILQVSKKTAQNETIMNTKRKSDSEFGYMTHAKVRKLYKDMALPKSVAEPVSKRMNEKADVEIHEKRNTNFLSASRKKPIIKLNRLTKIDIASQMKQIDEKKINKQRNNEASEVQKSPIREQQPIIENSGKNDFEMNEVDENSNNSINTVARFQFSPNEIVWAKIRGSPHWPAKVISIIPSRKTT